MTVANNSGLSTDPLISDPARINSFGGLAGQVGLEVGSWPSNRGIKSQGNPIILRDLTQECKKNL